MELVRGIRITEYCEQSRLPVAARLDLFICGVSRGCSIAHTEGGFIHRDLNRPNILVTLHDGAGAEGDRLWHREARWSRLGPTGRALTEFEHGDRPRRRT